MLPSSVGESSCNLVLAKCFLDGAYDVIVEDCDVLITSEDVDPIGSALPVALEITTLFPSTLAIGPMSSSSSSFFASTVMQRECRVILVAPTASLSVEIRSASQRSVEVQDTNPDYLTITGSNIDVSMRDVQVNNILHVRISRSGGVDMLRVRAATGIMFARTGHIAALTNSAVEVSVDPCRSSSIALVADDIVGVETTNGSAGCAVGKFWDGDGSTANVSLSQRQCNISLSEPMFQGFNQSVHLLAGTPRNKSEVVSADQCWRFLADRVHVTATALCEKDLSGYFCMEEPRNNFKHLWFGERVTDVVFRPSDLDALRDSVATEAESEAKFVIFRVQGIGMPTGVFHWLPSRSFTAVSPAHTHAFSGALLSTEFVSVVIHVEATPQAWFRKEPVNAANVEDVMRLLKAAKVSRKASLHPVMHAAAKAISRSQNGAFRDPFVRYFPRGACAAEVWIDANGDVFTECSHSDAGSVVNILVVTLFSLIISVFAVCWLNVAVKRTRNRLAAEALNRHSVYSSSRFGRPSAIEGAFLRHYYEVFFSILSLVEDTVRGIDMFPRLHGGRNRTRLADPDVPACCYRADATLRSQVNDFRGCCGCGCFDATGSDATASSDYEVEQSPWGFGSLAVETIGIGSEDSEERWRSNPSEFEEFDDSEVSLSGRAMYAFCCSTFYAHGVPSTPYVWNIVASTVSTYGLREAFVFIAFFVIAGGPPTVVWWHLWWWKVASRRIQWWSSTSESACTAFQVLTIVAGVCNVLAVIVHRFCAETAVDAAVKCGESPMPGARRNSQRDRFEAKMDFVVSVAVENIEHAPFASCYFSRFGGVRVVLMLWYYLYLFQLFVVIFLLSSGVLWLTLGAFFPPYTAVAIVAVASGLGAHLISVIHTVKVTQREAMADIRSRVAERVVELAEGPSCLELVTLQKTCVLANWLSDLREYIVHTDLVGVLSEGNVAATGPDTGLLGRLLFARRRMRQSAQDLPSEESSEHVAPTERYADWAFSAAEILTITRAVNYAIRASARLATVGRGSYQPSLLAVSLVEGCVPDWLSLFLSASGIDVVQSAMAAVLNPILGEVTSRRTLRLRFRSFGVLSPVLAQVSLPSVHPHSENV